MKCGITFLALTALREFKILQELVVHAWITDLTNFHNYFTQCFDYSGL